MIRNPEISSLVPALLAAIADPNGATRPALDTLLETVFVNTIDAASLVRAPPGSLRLFFVSFVCLPARNNARAPTSLPLMPRQLLMSTVLLAVAVRCLR